MKHLILLIISLLVLSCDSPTAVDAVNDVILITVINRGEWLLRLYQDDHLADVKTLNHKNLLCKEGVVEAIPEGQSAIFFIAHNNTTYRYENGVIIEED